MLKYKMKIIKKGDYYMKEIILNVEGMHCIGCENRIKNVLKTIPEVSEVEANHETGRVKILFKKEINMEEIRRKIENLDFKVID